MNFELQIKVFNLVLLAQSSLQCETEGSRFLFFLLAFGLLFSFWLLVFLLAFGFLFVCFLPLAFFFPLGGQKKRSLLFFPPYPSPQGYRGGQKTPSFPYPPSTFSLTKGRTGLEGNGFFFPNLWSEYSL